MSMMVTFYFVWQLDNAEYLFVIQAIQPKNNILSVIHFFIIFYGVDLFNKVEESQLPIIFVSVVLIVDWLP